MFAAFWTRNPKALPPEYTTYTLCKLFGWLPSQLEGEDAGTINLFLEFYSAEERVKEANQKAAEAKAQARNRTRN